jgi:hypothetical protein
MQTLPFWNSIEKCGLPVLVHTHGSVQYSEEVLLGDMDGDVIAGCLRICAATGNVKIQWDTGYHLFPLDQFTHWAYIPAVPKKEKE